MRALTISDHHLRAGNRENNKGNNAISDMAYYFPAADLFYIQGASHYT